MWHKLSFMFTIFLFLLSPASSKDLRVGECLAHPQSKRYIQGNFSSPYPREVSFSCQYSCLSAEGKEKLRATRSVTLTNRAQEAKKAVCRGVRVKEVSWGYEFDKVVPFYAYDTQMPVVKSWALKKLNFEGPLEQEYLNKLKKRLYQTARSYSEARGDSPLLASMRKAADILREMADQLPQSTMKLESYLEKIRQRNGTYPVRTRPEFWVFSALKSSADWRLPLFKPRMFWESL